MKLLTFYFSVYLQSLDDLDLLGKVFEQQLVPFVIFSPTPAVEIIQALSFCEIVPFFSSREKARQYSNRSQVNHDLRR